MLLFMHCSCIDVWHTHVAEVRFTLRLLVGLGAILQWAEVAAAASPGD